MNQEYSAPQFRLKPEHVRNEFPRKRKKKSLNDYLLKKFIPKSKAYPRGIEVRPFSVRNKNDQRCIIKVSYTKNSKSRSWAAHYEFTNTYLGTCHAKENETITGKIVGMGLEQELQDKRHLLLESIDGKVHYLRATHNIVKERDNFELKNDDIISVEKKPLAKHLHPNFDTTIIKNHGNFQDIAENKLNFIDEYIVDTVHKTMRLKIQDYPEASFAAGFHKQVQQRAHLLKQHNILIERANGECVMHPRHQEKIKTLNQELLLSPQQSIAENFNISRAMNKNKHQLQLER